jgi:hypothetical protein
LKSKSKFYFLDSHIAAFSACRISGQGNAKQSTQPQHRIYDASPTHCMSCGDRWIKSYKTPKTNSSFETTRNFSLIHTVRHEMRVLIVAFAILFVVLSTSFKDIDSDPPLSTWSGKLRKGAAGLMFLLRRKITQPPIKFLTGPH